MYDPRITLPGSMAPPPGAPARSARTLALVHQGRSIPLIDGDLLIGRAPTCHIVVDEALVSRVHAKIVITPEAVIVRDMASTNGVFVNAERIGRPTPLRAGDLVSIGRCELPVVALDSPEKGTQATSTEALGAPPKRDSGTSTAAERDRLPDGAGEGGSRPAPVRANSEKTEHTRKADAFQQLGAIADRMLEGGRADMAIRSLGGHLKQVLDGVRDGRELEPKTCTVASSYALRFAEAQGDGKWLDYVIELHLILKRPMNASLLDKLTILVRRRVSFDRELFGQYQAMLKRQERSMDLSDRVLCARILTIDVTR